MEQNLSERERKRRLAIGTGLLAVSAASYVGTDKIYLTAGIASVGLGFVVNYFTCFCSTKALIKKLKS